MASRRRPDPLRSQVEAESLVKYGPEGSALASLMRQLVADRDQDAAVAESTSRGVTNAARAAAPRVERAGALTKWELGGARTRVGEQMAGLSRVADAIKAATQRDFAGADARLGMELRRSQEELESRELDAASGRLAAVGAAQSTYAPDRAKIVERALDLARERGAFAQGRYGELRESQRGRQFTARESRRERAAKARESRRDRSFEAGQNAADRASKQRAASAKARTVKWATPFSTGP